MKPQPIKPEILLIPSPGKTVKSLVIPKGPKFTPLAYWDAFPNPRNEVATLYANFLGLGKKAQRRRDARWKAKTDLIQAQADATRILAQQGKAFQFRGTGSQALGAAKDIVGGLMGGGGGQGQAETADMYNSKPMPEIQSFTDTVSALATRKQSQGNNTMLYIGMGAAALVLILVIAKRK